MARFAPGANVLSRRRSIAWLAGAGAGLLHAPRVAFAADRVNIAISNSTADFAILIAMKRGYFAEEGIEANPTVFDSGGKMMAPLGAGRRHHLEPCLRNGVPLCGTRGIREEYGS